jgi:ParB family chromosome partitioning protein
MPESYVTVEVDKISVPEGRKPRADLSELKKSVEEIGLLNPISIDAENCLIAGRNRLEVFRLLGRTEIPACVFNLGSLHAELAEIDENLIRQKLDPFEEGQQLSRRKKIYETLHPDSKHGAAGGSTRVANCSKNSTKPPPGFVPDTAKKTGKSKTVLKDAVQVDAALTPEVKALIPGTSVAKSKAELKALANCDPADQVRVMQKVIDGEANTAREAIEKLEPTSARKQTADGGHDKGSAPDKRHELYSTANRINQLSTKLQKELDCVEQKFQMKLVDDELKSSFFTFLASKLQEARVQHKSKKTKIKA